MGTKEPAQPVRASFTRLWLGHCLDGFDLEAPEMLLCLKDDGQSAQAPILGQAIEIIGNCSPSWHCQWSKLFGLHILAAGFL
jgi:hypothetical protein